MLRPTRAAWNETVVELTSHNPKEIAAGFVAITTRHAASFRHSSRGCDDGDCTHADAELDTELDRRLSARILQQRASESEALLSLASYPFASFAQLSVVVDGDTFASFSFAWDAFFVSSLFMS